jgi:cytochrome b pre-mRNA-processing protein 3
MALYESAVAQARARALYARMGAPDTVEGRFELLTLHLILIIDRLKGEEGGRDGIGQALFDIYVSNLDGALREMGVGDLAVGKRMKDLGGAFYGRAKAYTSAFAALPDEGPLNEVVARTILVDSLGADPGALAHYVARCHSALASGESRALVEGYIPWPSGLDACL